MSVLLEAPPERPSVRRRSNGHEPPAPPPTGGGDDGERDPSPRRPLLDNVRLGMMFFIGAEVMFFGGLVSAFLVLRTAAPIWPPPLQPRLPVAVTGLNTLVLLASSVAMAVSARRLSAGDTRGFSRALALAGALGAGFLTVQGYEWARLIRFGLTVSSGAYGTTFYTLIGVHGLHVLGALIWLGATLALAASGRFADGRVGVPRACAIYWHFVVALWPILYVMVYLA
jgi:heme/copper-type cytochrome/quinol oxidase subunit 3